MNRRLFALLTLSLLPMLGAVCDVEPPCGRGELAPLPRKPTYAVVSSDYLSTAIALLDEEGDPITDAWLDSGTTRPGLSLTLNDVVLPSMPLEEDALTLIDRLGVDVITRIAMPNGEILGQIPTTPSQRDGRATFRANPHDVLPLGRGKALVSRFEPNLDPNAGPLERGSDLLVVELEGGANVDAISLSALDGHVDVAGAATHAYARPSRMMWVGPRIVVGLARLSTDWKAAPGAIAIVDPETKEVVPLDLPGLASCSSVVPIPTREDAVIVVCSGRPFTDLEGRREHAGIAVITVDAEGLARIERLIRAAEHPSIPVMTGGVVALDARAFIYVAMGDDRVGLPDRLVYYDLAREEHQLVLEAESAFVLGRGSYDPTTNLLLVPDANVGIHRFRVREGGLAPLGVTSVSRCSGLGPREIAALAPSRNASMTHLEDARQAEETLAVGSRGAQLRHVGVQCVSERHPHRE